MYLTYGFHIFSKNLAANIILIVQLTISIILMNITLGLYNEAYSKLDVLYGFDSDTVYQSFAEQYRLTFNENFEAYEEALSLSENVKLEPIMNGGAEFDGCYLSFCAYGSHTSHSMRLPITSGVWYDAAEKADGCINTVVLGSSKYHIGEIYTITVYNYMTGQSKDFKFKITGLIDEKTGVVLGYQSSNFMSVKTMFEVFDREESGTDALFLFNYEDEGISDYLSCGVFLFAYANNGSISDEDMSKLKNFGYTFTIDEIIDNTKNDLQSEIHSVFPLAVSLTFIGIVGILCLIILNTLKCRKTFAVYYICGMRWKDCIKIIIGQILCIFIGSLFLTVIAGVFMFVTNAFAETHLLIQWNNLFLTLGLFAMVFVVSLITAKCMLSNTSPVTDLKKE